ncbi:MAG TPA: ATP-dependent helicase HrpB [Dissulfurispiraceae bacterium]|nr:ATP-dependent helicase HrpB [Dissulfurispiraceae bacterium]
MSMGQQRRLCEFPVDQVIPQIEDALGMHGCAVLHAPPGSGKTTRVPLALANGIGGEGRIVMLEPRRIAAASAAHWMAHLSGENVGQRVGYAIRFDRKISAATRIEVVTEGILTRRMQADSSLAGTSLLIFDEFHERSIHADLALALALDIRQHLRPDLKILIMSATLDIAHIKRLLGDAPLISAEGFIFPVETHYVPPRAGAGLADSVAAAARAAMAERAGDVLVFLPGGREIRACADALARAKAKLGDVEVHPLFGDMPLAEQERAILPSGRRKIILATNIAETSLTIEGVSIVIDSGLTRRLHYDVATGLNRLITVPVTKASADQRKGRAGRLGPGICRRLFSKYTYDALQPFVQPEIMTADLSPLVLELAVWGVRNPCDLRWLDVPPESAWNSAQSLLVRLQALEDDGAVTALGKKLATFPLHPRLGRLLLRAADLGVPELGADIAALLSERDVVQSGAERRYEPDIMFRLDALHGWRRTGKAPSGGDSMAIQRADRVARQLLGLVRAQSRKPSVERASESMAALLLMAAYPDRLAQRRPDSRDCFVLSQGRAVRLAGPSLLSNSAYIIAAHLDAGTGGEGLLHIGAAVAEHEIREEMTERIEKKKVVEWDRRAQRVVATMQERIGAVLLSSIPDRPSPEEASSLLCDIVRERPSLLQFSKDALQLMGRVRLMRATFPGEAWPDLSVERLINHLDEWLVPWMRGVRSLDELARVDLHAALRALLPRHQQRLLERRAPTHLAIPSGRKEMLDYTAGDPPVLAVKLQEMFGLADTPRIAEGRVSVVLQLLSPARRPLQVTQDLKGFWNGSYQSVRREMKGRYPKHPWPEDPWNAVPTHKPKRSAR